MVGPNELWPGVEREDLICENAHAYSFLDAYPVSRGHALVVPRKRTPGLFDLEPRELDGVWELVARTRGLLVERFSPDGFTIGVNDGETAGQTVLHAHVHVIPRYRGDVPDPRGGIRWVIPEKAAYWND
jgi:diadenosine tetraphosphate (Ap4A) HIT family hydrolase